MNEYLNNLKAKFNYSEELMTFLAQLIPAMVSYYGQEYQNVILEALYDCEIHFQEKGENPQEYLSNYFGENKDWEMIEMGGAFYRKEIFLENNIVRSKPIIYVITVFYNNYKPLDFQNDNFLDMLVHEICHLVKGYGKLKVENGKILDSTGLMKNTYTYSLEGGVQEEIQTQVGIEEALNVVDSMKILEMITGRKQKPRGYKQAGDAAELLLRHEDIAKVIKKSQLNGDDNWVEYLGADHAKMLIDNFDVLVNALYVPYSEIAVLEKFMELHQKKNDASDEILDFIINYSSDIDKEVFKGVLRSSDEEMAKWIESIRLLDKQIEALDAIDNDVKKNRGCYYSAINDR